MARIKVRKQGTKVARSVDLSNFHNYEELIAELDQMFGFRGDLITCFGSMQKDWLIVYLENSDDQMLVGDDPWETFCELACEILILKNEEVRVASRIIDDIDHHVPHAGTS